ncbi:MAG TPA: riboflavin synthase, partial [Coleofasciculaceae cyanobacterium]
MATQWIGDRQGCILQVCPSLRMFTLGLHEKNTYRCWIVGFQRGLRTNLKELFKAVFTGLIQALGTIRSLGSDRFDVSCYADASDAILQDLAIGDSVAVDGICLTVEEILSKGFVATASDETLSRTTLGHPEQRAAYVNLETSMRVGSKLGGHFVTGHIDTIGCLQESVQTPNSWEMLFTAPNNLTDQWQHQISRYIVPKGSIAVNGVSLTVADCDPQCTWFKV